MYRVVFEYAGGRKGVCKEEGKHVVFETEQEAADYAADLNGRINADMKPYFPVYRAEKVNETRLDVTEATKNWAVLTDGEKCYVLRYDADHLRKYSELFTLPGWTLEKIRKELRADIETEIAGAFPNETAEKIERAAVLIAFYANANIYDPRAEEKK